MRRYLLAFAALAVLAAGAAKPVGAYTYSEAYYVPPEHIHWHVDTGYAATLGGISDYLDGGWTFGGGLSWQPDFRSPLSLRADLDYSRFQATRELIAINQAAGAPSIDDGFGETLGVDVDGEYRVPLSATLTGYTLAGIGFDYRRIALTQTVGVGDYFCDYYFGYCDYGLFPGQEVVASESTTRFAWNVGVGLRFALGGGQSFFVEARYLRLETRNPEDFIPIRVGIRF
jgi:opacity protein-like surface antigen